MKKITSILLLFLVFSICHSQVKDESLSSKQVVKKSTKPIKKTAYAYLLVTTDIDVEVSVNFSNSVLIKDSDRGKRLPLEKGDNLVEIIPIDGGDYGYTETINVTGKGNKVLSINLKDKKENYEIDESDNATTALEMIRNANYNVVITDLRMAEMDGMQLLKAIKLTQPDIQVIMILILSLL